MPEFLELPHYCARRAGIDHAVVRSAESKASGPPLLAGARLRCAAQGCGRRAVSCGEKGGRRCASRGEISSRTGLVAVAGLAYLMWVLDVPGLSSVRVAGIVMLVCGFAASASRGCARFRQVAARQQGLSRCHLAHRRGGVGRWSGSACRRERDWTQPRVGRDRRPLGDRDGASRAARLAVTGE